MDEFSSAQKCYTTPVFSGVPIKGDKTRRGYINPTFSGAHEWAKLQHTLYVLGGPHQKGTGDMNGPRRAGGKMPRGAVLKGCP